MSTESIPPKQPAYEVNQDMLEKSSTLNRTQFVLFVVFLASVLISTQLISDLDLLMMTKHVSVPIFGDVLSLRIFAKVAPWLIVVLHALSMIYLQEHFIKLDLWLVAKRRSMPEKDGWYTIRKDLPSFLFNYVQMERGFARPLGRFIAFCLIFCLPLVTLLFLQYRFLDLHEVTVSFVQYLSVIADALLVLWFYPAILFPAGIKARPRLKRLFLPVTLFSWRALKRLVRKRSVFAVRPSAGRVLLQLSVYLLVAIASFNLLVVAFVADRDLYKILAALAKGESPRVLFSLVLNPTSYDRYDATIPLHVDYPFFLPALEVYQETMTLYTPTLQEIETAKQSNMLEEVAYIKYTKGITGTNRDLTFARFIGCDLTQAAFEHVRMPYAILDRSKLLGARLSGSDLEGTSLSDADLRGVTLEHASLVDANLYRANLHSAVLDDAKLDHVNLQKSDLTAASLRRVDLVGKSLLGATVLCVNFSGSHLVALDLDGADLSCSRFLGTILSEVNLLVADLRNADLRGASLVQVQLQGADLTNAQLDGAHIKSSYIWAVNWPRSVNRSCLFEIDFGRAAVVPADLDVDKKDKLFKSLQRGASTFKTRVTEAKKFQPEYTITPIAQAIDTAFTQKRIELLYAEEIPIEHLLLPALAQSQAIHLADIVLHNRALANYCHSFYPHRFEELLCHEETKYPGITLK
jgi:uncharacterized protein YjbI with pentapeptide repeats